MKLWQCSICKAVGLWGPTWSCYSNIFVDDEEPALRLVTCSPVCEATAKEGINNGSIKFPVFKLRGPSAYKKSGPSGYKPQPDQAELVQIWNEQHPNDQISAGSAR